MDVFVPVHAIAITITNRPAVPAARPAWTADSRSDQCLEVAAAVHDDDFPRVVAEYRELGDLLIAYAHRYLDAPVVIVHAHDDFALRAVLADASGHLEVFE